MIRNIYSPVNNWLIKRYHSGSALGSIVFLVSVIHCHFWREMRRAQSCPRPLLHNLCEIVFNNENVQMKWRRPAVVYNGASAVSDKTPSKKASKDIQTQVQWLDSDFSDGGYRISKKHRAATHVEGWKPGPQGGYSGFQVTGRDRMEPKVKTPQKIPGLKINPQKISCWFCGNFSDAKVEAVEVLYTAGHHGTMQTIV